MLAGKRTGDLRRLAFGEAAGGTQPHARLRRHGGDRLRRRLGEQQQVTRLETMPRHAQFLGIFALRPQRLHKRGAVARDARPYHTRR